MELKKEKKLCCEKCTGYFEHRIGTHSDDRGGDSDNLCYCNLHDCRNKDCECHDAEKLEKLTRQQQKALHLLFTWVANSFNEHGLDMRAVLPPTIQIPWNKETVKKYIWKPIQKQQLLKESTTELLKKEEIDLVFDTMNREILAPKGIFVPFPSIEELLFLMRQKEYESRPNKKLKK